ncbi:MAG: hypothetical protein JXA77_13365 [Bacteroidales bacterium]|nr:hypothetical protein [Bacteroidales bacterium]MBN2818508.1 hypothetical protein [Bacteroidales bacterium]
MHFFFSIYEDYGINQVFSYIESYDAGEIMDVGYPELPQYTFFFWMPEDATTFTVSISNKTAETIYLTKRILPSQDTLEDSYLTYISEFFLDTSYYQSNGSLYNFDYKISEEFSLFGSKGVSLTIFPFKYNPLLNKVDVTKSCRFTITHNGTPGTAVASNTLSDLFLSKVLDNPEQSLPPIPVKGCHPFRSNAATF